MKEIQFEKGSVKVFTNEKEMTIERYSLFQKYLLLDSGVGSDINAVNSHFQKLHVFLANDRKEESIKEAENLHFSIYSVLNTINYQSLAFACRVKTIMYKDDHGTCEDVDDLSEEHLMRVTHLLSNIGATQGAIEDDNFEVKKKSLTSYQ